MVVSAIAWFRRACRYNVSTRTAYASPCRTNWEAFSTGVGTLRLSNRKRFPSNTFNVWQWPTAIATVIPNHLTRWHGLSPTLPDDSSSHATWRGEQMSLALLGSAVGGVMGMDLNPLRHYSID